MKHNFFIKNLLIFLLPLFIPLLILGSLSILITKNHIKDQITENNINTLTQTKTSIDLIFNEIDTLNIQIDTPSKTTLNLKRVLQQDKLTASDVENIDMISFFMNSFANTKPYINSIYVYYENDKGRFYTTNNSLSYLDNFYDSSWHDSYLNYTGSDNLWIEKRKIKQYDFQDTYTDLITVYKRMTQSNGVIVLNLKYDYIKDLLNNSLDSKDKKVLILDKNNEQLICSDSNFNLDALKTNELINENSNRIYSFSQGRFLNKALVHSDRFSWNYVALTPEDSLYSISTRLIELTIMLLIVSFILGVTLTFYLTKKRYTQINNIISIIDSAKNNNPLPIVKSNKTNEYSYIIENLITAFIEQNYLRLQLSERKYKLENMELIALQSQINPHFLFNTLHTIYWEVIKCAGFKSKPVKMIEDLSSILEYSLAAPSKYVSLKEEIEYTKTYLDIQMIRYSNKFEVTWEYDDNVNTIPSIKLLLQPLVENSINHGINAKESIKKGKIKIKICIKGNFIRIAVIDNGAGINSQELKNIRCKLLSYEDCTNHIGLFNTNKRLKLTYGEEYGLKINSKEGFGTAIYITFPTKYKK